MKTLVIYKSKYGSTKKYAEWIGEELEARVLEVSQAAAPDLEKYNNIIYCGGLYAGNIIGLSFIKKNFNILNGKKIVIAAVGATLKGENEISKIENEILPPEMRGKVGFYLLRGALDYKKMNFIHRMMMFFYVSKLKKENRQDEDSKGLIATYGKTADFTDKKLILPIIEIIKM